MSPGTVEELPVWGLAGVSWRQRNKISEMGITEFTAGRTMGKVDSQDEKQDLWERHQKIEKPSIGRIIKVGTETIEIWSDGEPGANSFKE